MDNCVCTESRAFPIVYPFPQLAQEYHLRLYHTHTGKRLDIVYRRENSYSEQALTTLDNFLRDHRTNGVHQHLLQINRVETVAVVVAVRR